MKNKPIPKQANNIDLIWDKYLVEAVQQWKAEIMQSIVALMLTCHYTTLNPPKVCVKRGVPEAYCSFYKGRAYFYISATPQGFSVTVRELKEDSLTGKVFLDLREECSKNNTILKVHNIEFVLKMLKIFMIKIKEAGLDAVN